MPTQVGSWVIPSTLGGTLGITLEALQSPAPAVGITVKELDPAATSVVTVWRSVDGMNRQAVRGAKETPVAGSDYFIDYEVPLGRPVGYTVEVVDGDVTPDITSAVITVDSEVGWLQDPVSPGAAIPVATWITPDGAPYLAADAFAQFVHELPGEMAQVMGADWPTFLSSGRLAASGIPFSVFCRAAEWNSELEALLAQSGVLLLRGPAGPAWEGFPPLAYMAVRATKNLPWPRGIALATRWELVGDLAAPPTISVIAPLWTYNDVELLWSTYAQEQDAATLAGVTYTDVVRDPTIGGTTA